MYISQNVQSIHIEIYKIYKYTKCI